MAKIMTTRSRCTTNWERGRGPTVHWEKGSSKSKKKKMCE